MCGICGFYSSRKETMENLIEMNQELKHRGPDDSGEEIYRISSDYLVGFAHRRLSIMDLSKAGHQPMHSENKQVSVVFNGEIYNYRAIKKELQDYPFQSNCDTEVIIAAYLKWGISFIEKIHGMFAIALLDRKINVLYLIRDRIGEKPLYYYISDKNLYFSSELKALMKSRFFERRINKDILGRLLNKQYISSPDSIFENVYKLEPGAVLCFQNGNITIKKYWDIIEKYHQLSEDESRADFETTKEILKEKLVYAVEQMLAADVPVGAFLSGGYDSSLVCAIAQEQLSSPLRTYCIGFEDPKQNEAEYAKRVADFLGTKHTEQYISEQEMLDLVRDIPRYYDEPFADPSQIPTMLVSKLARKDVTVVLSGDGGDEFFSGYNIYSKLQKAQKLDRWGAVLYYLRKIPMAGSRISSHLPLLYRMVSDERDPEIKTQTGINSYVNSIHAILLDEGKSCYYPVESKYHVKEWDIRRMLLDMRTYLPDDILCKVDRASMKYSLECRCPILDVDVMEYSYAIPQYYKNDNGNQKKILKSIAYDYIPKELLDRPKAGFSVPLDRWLREPLQAQLLEFIDTDLLKNQGIFHIENTQKLVLDYLKNGDRGKDSGMNFSKIIWPFFTFQQWYCEYMA